MHTNSRLLLEERLLERKLSGLLKKQKGLDGETKKIGERLADLRAQPAVSGSIRRASKIKMEMDALRRHGIAPPQS